MVAAACSNVSKRVVVITRGAAGGVVVADGTNGEHASDGARMLLLEADADARWVRIKRRWRRVGAQSAHVDETHRV